MFKEEKNQIKKTISNLKSISYIFPVFNEEERLINLFKYLDKNITHKNQEVIFVNDGSFDSSKTLIKNYIVKKNKENKYNFILITYNKNKGKGFALKKGVQRSKKEWILTLDVDLSAKFSELNSWLNKKYILKEKNFSYFGSRVLSGANVDAIYIRKFLGNIFLIFEKILINSRVNDTQCGFKLYHKSYVKKVFKSLKTCGFAHDVEIIFLLHKYNINIKELPINWTHKTGSKINVVLDSINMIYEIIKIKLRYF